MSAAGEGWTEPNLYFLSLPREKMQTIPVRVTFPQEIKPRTDHNRFPVPVFTIPYGSHRTIDTLLCNSVLPYRTINTP